MNEQPNIPNVPTDRPLSLRKLRHSIQKHAFFGAKYTAGQTGLSKADQMIRLDNAVEQLEIALAKAKAARDLVASRDFDAHQAEKQAAQAKAQAEAAAQQAESLPESEEKAQEALTFDQLVAQLADMGPDGVTSPKGDQGPEGDTGPQSESIPPF